MSAVWELDLAAGEKLVMLALADNANDEGLCWPSIATIARKCGKGERSVQQALRQLESDGLLTREEVIGKGCKYTLNPRNKCTPAEIAPAQKTTKTPAESAPKPSGTIIPKKGKPSLGKRAHKKPAVPLAEDWYPKPLKSDGVCAGIVASWSPGRIERELSKFKDHHLRSDQHWSDWDAAWRTWIQRAPEFERDGKSGNWAGGGRVVGSGPSATLRIRQAAAAAEREDAENYQRSWPSLPAAGHG